MSNLFVPRDPLQKAAAIIVLTGNGWERTIFAIELYQAGWAPRLVMVGSTGSRPPAEMAAYAREHSIPSADILISPRSNNTRGNAEEVLKLAEEQNWKAIILVTSPHHQLRACLTFRKVQRERYDHIQIINYPPTNYSWFELVESSRDKTKQHYRFWYFFGELYHIAKYWLKGDL